MSTRTLRLEDLLGRRVHSVDGFPVGRIEELIARRQHRELEVVEYHLGSGALLERWSVTRRLTGRKSHQYIVKWDQIDIAHSHGPRLLCPVEDLEKRTI
jgi:hypothetical protein